MAAASPMVLHRGRPTSSSSRLLELGSAGGRVFHGTSEPCTTLLPRQPMNRALGARAEIGVYASDDPDYAIFMSLARAGRASVAVSTYRHDLGVVCAAHPAMLELMKRPDIIGYVHVCRRELFEELHPREFIARQPVVPEQIIPVSAADLPTVFEPHDIWPEQQLHSLTDVLQRLPVDLVGSANPLKGRPVPTSER